MRSKAFVTTLAVGGLLLAGQAAFPAAHFIPGDTSIGTWDAKTRTYTLTTDVTGEIYIWGEDDVTLDGAGHTVTLTDYWHRGVVAVYSSNITVRDVTVQGPGYGGPYTGIYFTVSGSCTAVDNVITDCAFGIWLYDTPSCTITGNTLSYCGFTILLAESDYCTLMRNTVSHTYWYGVWFLESNYSLFYNNNVIASGWHHAVVDDSAGNVFSLPWPIGGNHWSGWTGPDADGDGIVDSPYMFYGGHDDLPWTTLDGWLALGPGDQILALAAWVETLGLPAGLSNSLDAKLQAAFGVLEDANPRNDGAAANSLAAFVNAVEAQRGKKISAVEADMLIAVAEVIVARLGE